MDSEAERQGQLEERGDQIRHNITFIQKVGDLVVENDVL